MTGRSGCGKCRLENERGILNDRYMISLGLGKWIGRGDVEYRAEIARISEQNNLVVSGGDPGNCHRHVPLGDGHLSSEDYWEGPVVLAEIDHSSWVRNLVRGRGRIPSERVCLPRAEIDARSGVSKSRSPDILSAGFRRADSEGRDNTSEEGGEELHGGRGEE